ncbi:hypothetical protein [Mesorhizobium sp.]|uniref:hypothetical protein n=1 Tax=Mesorhizobium sp. TaxID=1871066 RepID=UPI0025EA5874|nr:hypothetical protein [Mesorhizobium sp.]
MTPVQAGDMDQISPAPHITCDGIRARRILGVHGCFFDLRATASIKERAAASQAVLDGPFADSTTSADFSDMPYFLAKAAMS